MTDCERTTLYLDNELPAGEEAAALAHLATCAQCQADVDDWVAMETMLSRPGSGGARASIARGPAPAAADVVALRP
ncbi:MAG TPA: zf-HC2 domain-containing protein, partial [Kofleriaceae bacterium]